MGLAVVGYSRSHLGLLISYTSTLLVCGLWPAHLLIYEDVELRMLGKGPRSRNVRHVFLIAQRGSGRSWVNQQSQCADGSEHSIFMCSASLMGVQNLSFMFSISYMCSASLTCVQLLSWVFSISHVCSASLSSFQWISSNCIVKVPHTNLHKWKSRSNCGLSRDSGMEDEVQSLSKACHMLPTGLPS